MLDRTACPGCGLTIASAALDYDRKFNASAACWSVFEDVIALEFQNATLFRGAHQITVDAYAVQHAGGRHPDKSVDVHLVGLYWTMEMGVAPTEVPRKLQAMVSGNKIWPHFEVPAAGAKLTVQDVKLASGSMEAHIARVREWGAAVWKSWGVHHDAVRRLAAGTLAGR